MATVRRLHSRGANTVVEAHGEVLFAPGSDLSRWKNRLSQRVRAGTEAAAPTNKRPRWGHYGKPLKATFTATTFTRVTKGGGFFYVGVGSKSPHAYYVDQGTAVYAGRGPYVARVLPPYTRGGPSLYESTWRPGGPNSRRVRPVFIKGQKGQKFMERGLKAGLQSMRLRSHQLPGEGVSGMAAAFAATPTGLEGFFGNTPNDEGFRASLQEWRTWRDAAFNKNFELGSGRTGSRGTRRSVGSGSRMKRREGMKPYRRRRTEAQNERRRQESRKRSQRLRDAQTARKKQALAKERKSKGVSFAQRQRAERARFLAAAAKKFGASNVILDTLRFVDGHYTVTVIPPGPGNQKRFPKTIKGRDINSGR